MSNLRTLAIVAVLVATCGCGLSAQSPQERADLQAAIKSVDVQITAAQAEDAKYSGGLIKSLLGSRIATLGQTKAMLEQRANASAFSIALRYTVDGKAFTPPSDAREQAASVELELAAVRAKIEAGRVEAARYSGGLVLAMTLSSVATMQQTEAMLDQKRLALKYGLPQYLGFASTAAGSGTPPRATASGASQAGATERARQELAQLFEVVSIDSKVTESNDVWWKFAWKLTLRNKSSEAAAFRATIDFYDKDGFVVDSTTSDTLVVPGSADEAFAGTKLVTTSAARNVTRSGAKVAVVSR